MVKRIRVLVYMVVISMMLSINVGAISSNILTINYGYNGVKFSVYKVGEYSVGEYRLSEGFKGYSIDLNKGEWKELGAALSGYISRDKISEDYSGVINGGKLKISGVTDGVYAIIGGIVIDGGIKYTPIVSLIDVRGNMVINIKHEEDVVSENSSKSYTVRKEWYKDNDGVRPSSIEVELLRDGKVYDTVVLNGGNNWEYKWDNLSTYNNWQVVEKDVPDNYGVSIVQVGEVVTIKNVYKDSEVGIPDENEDEDEDIDLWDDDVPKDDIDIPDSNKNDTPSEKIPQTGQNWSIAIILGVSGVVLLVLDSKHRISNKKR